MNIQSIYRSAFLSAARSTLSLIGTTQVVASDLTLGTRQHQGQLRGPEPLQHRRRNRVVRAHQERRQAACGYEGSSLTDISLWRRCVHEAVADASAA
jgi:hypothetical protein